MSAKRVKNKCKTKIDKVLDWLVEKDSEWNYHQDFWKFVSPPANRTYNEIYEWLNSRMEKFLGNDSPPPFNIYSGDITRWKENNAEKLIGTSAIALREKQGTWVGIDSYQALAATLGQMAYLSNFYYEEIKASEEIDTKKVYLLEKLAARTAIIAAMLSSLELDRDKQEIGLGFSYQLANDIKSMANQDPNATSQMREWLIELLSAGLAKQEEQVK